MNLITKKTTTILLAAFAALALSGCGSEGTPSETGIIPGITPPDGNGTDPLKGMTTVQAKDAMALNALFYPIIVPLQSCLGDIPQCITDLYNPAPMQPTSTVAVTPSIVQIDPMAPGSHNCTPGNAAKGQYTVDSNDPLVVRFDTDPNNPGCYDVANAQDIQGALMSTCINTILGTSIGSSNAGGAIRSSGYEVQYEGKVTCTSKTSAVLENYIVSAFGQTDPVNNPNRHSYNMTVSMTSGLGIDGTYQAEKWAPSGVVTDPKINDEIWTFNALNIASTGSAVVANGGASYVGTVRENDTANNGMTLAIDFSNLSYAMSGSLADTDVTVTGGVSASCQPEVVTYRTTATMNDLNNLRDAAANRMPNKGSMSMALPGFNPAPAVFTAPGTAQVDITSSEGTVTYPSWRAITTTSSCAVFQDILDRVIGPNKPVASIEISEGCASSEGPLINNANPLILDPGETQCINAFANYSDGTKGRVTTSVFWTSSDRDIVTMPLLQTSSQVTASRRNTGSTMVNATLYGVTGSAPVNVLSK